MKFRFSKTERLSGKKLIDELFKTGSSFYFPPFKVVFLLRNSLADSLPQILISVPAKNFKRAVDRNRIKRLTREAYRLNKSLILDSCSKQKKQLLIGFVFTSKKIEPFSLVNERIISILKKLSRLNAVEASDSN